MVHRIHKVFCCKCTHLLVMTKMNFLLTSLLLLGQASAGVIYIYTSSNRGTECRSNALNPYMAWNDAGNTFPGLPTEADFKHYYYIQADGSICKISQSVSSGAHSATHGRNEWITKFYFSQQQTFEKSTMTSTLWIHITTARTHSYLHHHKETHHVQLSNQSN